jgi:hypothetical protein
VDSLGFRIAEDDGLHYGYITVDTPFLGLHGGFIQGYGYESNPTTGIIVGAVPEPSNWLLVMTGGAACILKRRRKYREDNKSEQATPRKPSD